MWSKAGFYPGKLNSVNLGLLQSYIEGFSNGESISVKFNRFRNAISRYIPRRIPEHPDTQITNLSSKDTGKKSITLSWEKPRTERVLQYEIEYKEQAVVDWENAARVNNNVFLYIIENLKENIVYQFRVRGIFPYGKFGLYSDEVECMIKPSVNEDKAKQVQIRPIRQSTKPGRLRATEVRSDSVSLAWDKPTDDKRVDHYEMKTKTSKQPKWPRTSVLTNADQLYLRVTGLTQNTEYEFKVFVDEDVGEFSDKIDKIKTRPSPILGILPSCIKIQNGNPCIYKLPWKNINSARNDDHKTRKCEFGTPISGNYQYEKTIMMIGATGAGKSTMVDGMINCLLGVKWEDDFRFKAIHIMPDEEQRQGQQALSQTEWITNYTLHPRNNTIKYRLNVIDTPGLGDTRGIKRDEQLMEQIKAFFSQKGVKGIETLDAVCFVVQASSARLTPSQKYIFDSILSIFGKDIAKNIVPMITFADGNDPPALNALKMAGVPFERHFLINNCALYKPQENNDLGKTFWEISFRNYDDFLKFLPTLETQSLQLTAEVLKNRERLSVTVQGIMQLIDTCLQDLAAIKQEKEQLEKCQRDIEGCEDFKYKTTEQHGEHIALSPGEYVTNCRFCHITCHYPCYIPSSTQKRGCAVIHNGNCSVCTNNCVWSMHEADDYRIEFQTVTIVKTLDDMKCKYDFATKEKATKEDLLQAMKKKYIAKYKDMRSMLTKARNYGNYLRHNAIKANPLSEIEYLEVLIANELQEKKDGFQDRVKVLKGLGRKAKLSASATASNESNQEELLQQLGFDDI